MKTPLPKEVRCHIDADILVYEIASCGEFIDPDSGELIVLNFESVAENLDQKIREIEEECWATEPSTLYLTNDKALHKMWARYFKTIGRGVPDYRENFRVGRATAKPYKGNRKPEKPFHRDNIRAYMMANYDFRIANGMEADDLLAMDQHENSIICTRDKDLRMVKGWHFGWPCGKQPQFGPHKVEGVGEISYDAGKKKITGTGIKFFYSQVLTGDTTDNYGGLSGCGPKRAYTLLESLDSEADLRQAVEGAYRDKLGDGWREAFLEQADLAWMCLGVMPDGTAIKYSDLE